MQDLFLGIALGMLVGMIAGFILGAFMVRPDREATPRPAAMKAALEAIIRARDEHAEGEPYPYDESDQCFDDWAADLASNALEAA